MPGSQQIILFALEATLTNDQHCLIVGLADSPPLELGSLGLFFAVLRENALELVSVPKSALAMLPLLAGVLLPAQHLPYPTAVSPPVLFVGSSGVTFDLYNQSYQPGLSALWNGSPRATAPGPTGGYAVTLTAADLASPQLAQVQMVDSQSNAVIDTVTVPVGYNVLPVGIALDQMRNRVYVSTPAQPGDPLFPGNSVVAVDLSTGKIGPVLQIGNFLGDIALSDDASKLYVVDEGDSVVQRIDPATLTKISSFPYRPPVVPFPYGGGYSFDSITVMPGKPDTLVVGYYPDPRSSPTQLTIFDSGVPRPNSLSYGPLTGIFSPDGAYLFTSGGNYEDPTVARYSLDATGIPKQTTPAAAGSGPVLIAGSTLYSSLATTIDYNSMTVTGNFGIGGPLTVDSASQRAYILYTPPADSSSGSTPPIELVAFALPSLETLGTQDIGVPSKAIVNSPENLIRFGTDGFILPSTSGLLIFHTPLAGPAPALTANAVVNAASQQSGAIAPGEILTIYGVNLGPSAARPASASDGMIASQLGDVQVWFGSTAGVPLYASQGQINVVAPFELQSGTQVDLQVLYFGNPSARIPLPVAATAPALFTQNGSGVGPVVAINQDGSINTPSPPGSVVVMYGTGGGTAGHAVDGFLARGAQNLDAPVTVTVSGHSAQVLYAIQIPTGIASGPASIVVNIGGINSPSGASLEIR